MLKIAGLKIPSRLILAPLAGVTDLAYRLMARRFGCEFAFLEMLNVRSMSHKNRKIKELLKTDHHDSPLGAQILGCEIDYLLKGAKALEALGVSLIDFNAACPVKKVVRRGEGAALLKHPCKLAGILKALKKELRVPLTLKIRSGWDQESINAVEIAGLAEKAGVSAVIIHGRHRAQGYSGRVSYEVIRQVKKSVNIPVVASGDILSAQLAKKMFEETNCDGLMIARGSIGKPWIFQEIDEFVNRGILLPPPDFKEIQEIILRHVELAIENYGEAIAMVKMRRLLAFYIKNIPGARKFRARINEIKRETDLRQLLREFT